MLFGRELSLPIDIMIGRPPESGTVDVSDYVSYLREKLEVAHHIAWEKLNYSAQRKRNMTIWLKRNLTLKGILNGSIA